MTSDTLSIPKLTAGPTVYYPTQTGSVTASDQTWGQIALKAEGVRFSRRSQRRSPRTLLST